MGATSLTIPTRRQTVARFRGTYGWFSLPSCSIWAGGSCRVPAGSLDGSDVSERAVPGLDEPSAVDAAVTRDFENAGHALIRGLATASEVAPFRSLIAAIVDRDSASSAPVEDRDTYGQAFLQSANLWRREGGLAPFTLSRRFAAAAATLLGVDAVRLYHDQALFKEPDGGRTPWHRDQVYWPVETDRTVTMWMPLVDVSPEMGGVVFASGSHRLEVDDLMISDDSDASLARAVEEAGLDVECHAPMAAGDATFHLGRTLHAASPNETDVLREVMTVIYVADGVRVAEPTPAQRFDLAAWLPGLEPGDLVDTAVNPLLWSVPAGDAPVAPGHGGTDDD